MNLPAITQAQSPREFPVGEHVLHRGEVYRITKATRVLYLDMTEYDLEPKPGYDGPVKRLGTLSWKKRL